MRNITKKQKPQGVALHPEGVDRNTSAKNPLSTPPKVALHPEGVDRNGSRRNIHQKIIRSPSTRRAWIEMRNDTGVNPYEKVALHPEGVDRNWSAGISIMIAPMSPSTRRAWIEISIFPRRSAKEIRSPSTRRAWIEISSSPGQFAVIVSPSTRRAWIEISNIVFTAIRRCVALHPEGVDRNQLVRRERFHTHRRPPPGGRG